MADITSVMRQPAFRWVQLVMGIVCMGFIANLQYGWTLFVNPIQVKNEWALSSIQLAFSIFVVVETWLVPVEGWLVDKFGPRTAVAAGAILAAAGWVIDAYATSLAHLYLGAVVAGLGAGCVYGTCVGNALKWIKPTPPAGVRAAPRVVTTKKDYTTGEMMRTPVFWLTYALFVAVAAGGLMATAQIGPIAKDYHLDKLPMAILGLTMPLLTMTLAIDNLANGFTRPLCGFISDRIGRENTMMIVFIGEGLALLGLMTWGHHPVAFMTFAALIFLFWGEIFSIFPALCADTFGVKNAAANAGTLYTAKGAASLLVPLASVLSAGGNWDRVFMITAAVTITAGLLAKLVLAPMRKRCIDEANASIGRG